MTRRITSAVTAGAALVASHAHAAGNDTIRVGVIGCGGRGRGAAVNAVDSSPNVQVVALADVFPDAIDVTLKLSVDRPRQQFNVTRDRCFVGLGAYKQLLQTDANYIILATPPAFRPAHLLAAIEAGKHVYAESAFAVDPAGVRKLLAAADLAKRKNLGIRGGLMRRIEPGYIECIKRIHDGAIGRVLLVSVCWLAGASRFPVQPREPQWSDLEWQFRNWSYFTWLSGDQIVEQHIHNLDVAAWILDERPFSAFGMGGRQTPAEIGNTFDHFAVEYAYKSGARVESMCRQIEGTYSRVGEQVVGTKGYATAGRILLHNGQIIPFPIPNPNPPFNWPNHLQSEFIDSIRAGTPLNEGHRLAESTLMAIMGRMSAYDGRSLVRWDDAKNSPLDLMPPRLEFGPPLPVAPIARPGVQPGTRD
jgi:myo-inositol 2-dehydrogenase / D-chiro-inositol 1-dehydrogenase